MSEKYYNFVKRHTKQNIKSAPITWQEAVRQGNESEDLHWDTWTDAAGLTQELKRNMNENDDMRCYVCQFCNQTKTECTCEEDFAECYAKTAVRAGRE